MICFGSSMWFRNKHSCIVKALAGRNNNLQRFRLDPTRSNTHFKINALKALNVGFVQHSAKIKISLSLSIDPD